MVKRYYFSSMATTFFLLISTSENIFRVKTQFKKFMLKSAHVGTFPTVFPLRPFFSLTNVSKIKTMKLPTNISFLAKWNRKKLHKFK